MEKSILIQKMEKYGIEPKYCRFIEDWMTHRSLVVSMNDQQSETVPISRGLPQGSTLSVYLWQLYVSDMPLDVERSALYMDDTALWQTAKSRESLEIAMQHDLTILHKWCVKNHVVINTDKTVVMVNDLDNEVTLELEGKLIKTVKPTKYLGVHLVSKKGDFEQIYINVDGLKSDMRNLTNLLKLLKNKLPQHLLYMVGNSLLLSKLNYHLPIMGAEKDTGVFDQLRVSLNDYLRVLCHAPRSTPIPLLHSQTGIPPIEILLKKTVVSNLARTMTNPDEIFEQSFWKWNGSGWNTSPFHVYNQMRSAIPVAEV